MFIVYFMLCVHRIFDREPLETMSADRSSRGLCACLLLNWMNAVALQFV